MQFKFVPEIRIGDSKDWIACGMGKACESKEQAESIAAQFAKYWLGVAESRASEVEVEVESESSESLAQCFAKEETKRCKRKEAA